MNKMKLITGKVVGKVGNKSIKVLYSVDVRHPKYLKVIKYRKNYIVHDENNQCIVGDIVKFRYARPLSRTKSFIFVEKVN